MIETCSLGWDIVRFGAFCFCFGIAATLGIQGIFGK